VVKVKSDFNRLTWFQFVSEQRRDQATAHLVACVNSFLARGTLFVLSEPARLADRPFPFIGWGNQRKSSNKLLTILQRCAQTERVLSDLFKELPDLFVCGRIRVTHQSISHCWGACLS
jgi:hypothetical protein